MPIDLICLAVLGYGFWQGFNRGIISTAFNVAAYLFGIVLALKMTPTTTDILQRLFNSDNPMMPVASFVVNVVFVMIFMRMAAKSLESAMRAAYLGFFNQVAGGILLGGVAVMMYSVLVWFSVKASLVNEATLNESRLYEPFLKDLPSQAFDAAKRLRPLAEDVWDSSMNWMDRLETYKDKKNDGKPKIYEVPDDDRFHGIEDAPAPSKSKPAENSGIEE